MHAWAKDLELMKETFHITKKVSSELKEITQEILIKIPDLENLLKDKKISDRLQETDFKMDRICSQQYQLSQDLRMFRAEFKNFSNKFSKKSIWQKLKDLFKKEDGKK